MVSQTGKAPLQVVLALLAVQATHCPSARQAGRAELLDLHWVSAMQEALAFFVRSQMGWEGEVH